MEHAQNAQTALRLKASLHPFTLLELSSLDLAAIEADLSQRLKQAPELLKNAPIVVAMPKQPISLDWADELVACLRKLGFIPVGLRIEQTQDALAEHLNLPIFSEATRNRPPPEADVPTLKSHKVVSTVRSGQQLVNANGDITVLGNVGQGAEVLASGSIHIHGNLYGRALAGINGDPQATISCQNFQSELVAISGQYLVSEDLPQRHWQKVCYISLRDERLNIESI
ncbi:septum site-determining protein MinC [Bermanella sp. R86510]|uniref:septum site-determining protein MinC n=1 Tax=unclassified Bermanella TaxID=2627862 RepID=UPI0037C59B9F